MVRNFFLFGSAAAIACCSGPVPQDQVARTHVDYDRAVEQDKRDWSPLHLAALEGDMERVAALVDAGADVRAENPGSLWTALHIASLYDKERVLQFLVETWRHQYDDEPDIDGLLFTAVIHGNHHCVDYLLAQGGDPNARRSHDFEPQLYVAASHDHQETVELLLANGVDFEATTTSGLTALHGAATKGVRGVRLLLEHGADPNARAANGYTPLHVAAESGRAEAVAYLLAHGADPNALTDGGRTARELAVRNERVDVVRVLDTSAKN